MGSEIKLEIPDDGPVLPSCDHLSPLTCASGVEVRPACVLGVGAGHLLGTVLDWSIRHDDQRWIAVVEYFGAVAVLTPMMRSYEHVNVPQQAADLWALE